MYRIVYWKAGGWRLFWKENLTDSEALKYSNSLKVEGWKSVTIIGQDEEWEIEHE